jgi:voltage-gated potassium channel
MRPATDDSQRLMRAVFALGLVLSLGTTGFVLIEGWDVWRSLYFTVITITTVGFGDEGIGEMGKRFTTVLLLGGIATATYAFGQIVQIAVSSQNRWRSRMDQTIKRLNDHFIVCGLGTVGRTVCHRLQEEGAPFVVVEADAERVERGCALGYLVLQGSATEDDVLHSAGIDRARGIVCAVNSDSDNIVITLSARTLNPTIQIVSRVDADDAEHKVERAGASHVVSPGIKGGMEIADVLVRPRLAAFLRQSSTDKTGFRLGEIEIRSGSPLVGRTLREYGESEPGILFVAITSEDGTTRSRPPISEPIRADDTMIVAGDADSLCRMRDAAEARTSRALEPVAG